MTQTVLLKSLVAGIFFIFSGLTGGFSAWSGEENHAAPPASGQKLVWTDIHNGTGRTVHFQAGLLWREGDLKKFTLEPGEKQHFPGGSALKVLFSREDRLILYRLNPGPRYFFRLDEAGGLDLFAEPPVDEALRFFVPFVVTPEEVIARMLETAGLTSDDVLYDLGCGDGRIVIAAAEKYGARGVGIDIDPLRIQEARQKSVRHGVSELVTFREQDALKTDLEAATVVAIYMSMQFNQKLRDLFMARLKPGARVVAHNYAVPGWARHLVRYETMKTANGTEHIIYLYQR
ncbi:MAG: methyltransferase domain-containing protein [Candidatus Aminicenantes bacterium]